MSIFCRRFYRRLCSVAPIIGLCAAYRTRTYTDFLTIYLRYYTDYQYAYL